MQKVEPNRVKAFLTSLEILNGMKVDVKTNPKNIGFDNGIMLLDDIRLPMSKVADAQLAERIDIPIGYYNKLRKLGELKLLDRNVLAMLDHYEKDLFIRTYQSDNENITRAVLSDRYRAIDNLDVYLCALDEMADKSVDVENLVLDDKYMTIQFKSQDMVSEVKPGDEVIGGISIRNSETGFASVNVVPRIFQVQCRNGWVIEKFQTRKVHLGKGHGGSFENSMVYNDIRASIRHTFDSFGPIVARLKDSTDHKFDLSKIRDVFQNIVDEFSLSEEQRDNLLLRWGEKPEPTLYGVGCAVTRAAQDQLDFENKYRMETIGGHLVTEDPAKLFKKFIN